MGYVALSRVRSIKHLILDGLNGMALRVSPEAKQIDSDLRAKSGAALHDFAAPIGQWEADEASGEHEKQMDEMSGSVLSSADSELYEKLRTWRTALAVKNSVPGYIIANNKTLEEIARRKPQTEKDLIKVPGLGPKKIETYGADILAITTLAI
jgi:superfamily II DNA helicase RecQ